MAFPSNAIPNPSVLPTHEGAGVALSGDGQFLAVAQYYLAPNLTTYKKVGSPAAWVQMTVDVQPADFAQCVTMSDDGNYLVVGTDRTPRININKRSGDTWVRQADPATLPPESARAVQFSANGVYLAVAHTTSPFISIYKRSGDVFTKLANPDVLPPNNGYGVGFSADGNFMAVTTNVSPYVLLYARTGDTFTKLPDPDVPPLAWGHAVGLSLDGTYMVVGHATSPYVTFYKRTGTTVTKMASEAGLGVVYEIFGVDFSNDDKYLALASRGTGYAFSREGDVFTLLPQFGTGYSGDDVDFSADGTTIALGIQSSPYVLTWATPAPLTTNTAIVLPKLSANGYIGQYADTPSPSVSVQPATAYMSGTSGFVKSQDVSVVSSGGFALPAFQAAATAKISQSVRAAPILPKFIGSGLIGVEGRNFTADAILPKFGAKALLILDPILNFALRLPAFTAAAEVWQPVRMLGTPNLPKLVGQATVFQTVEIKGDGGMAFPALRGESLVFQDIWIDGDAVFPMLSTQGVVFQPVRIDGAPVLPMFSVEADVDDTYPIYDIVAAPVLPVFSADGSVTVPQGFIASVRLPGLTADGYGVVPVQGRGASNLLAFTSDGLVGVEGLIYADLVMPKLGFKGDLGYPILVDANVQLPRFGFAIVAKPILAINAATMLPMFKVRAIVRYGDPLPATGSGTAVGLDGEGSFQLGGNIKFGNGRRTFP